MQRPPVLIPLIRLSLIINQARPSITATKRGQLIGLPCRILDLTSNVSLRQLLINALILASLYKVFSYLMNSLGILSIASISYIKSQSTLSYAFSWSRKSIQQPPQRVGARGSPQTLYLVEYINIIAWTARTLSLISRLGRKAYWQSPMTSSRLRTRRCIRISIQILQSIFINDSGRQFFRSVLLPLFLKSTVRMPFVQSFSRLPVAQMLQKRCSKCWITSVSSGLKFVTSGFIRFSGSLVIALYSSLTSLSSPGDFLIAARRINKSISCLVIALVKVVAVRLLSLAVTILRTVSCA